MRKLTLLIILGAFVLCAHAETIILRTGARVKGTVVFRNEEVLVVRDAAGARFQYPRAEVQEVLADDAQKEQPEETAVPEQEEIKTVKKVSALLELSGGAAVKPNEAAGAGVGADLIIGTHHIGNRHLFIGGGLGYHGVFIGGDAYHFLPVQIAFRMPFTEEKHAPVFGVALGYGVALSKNYVGGLYAGLDFGYRCQVNPKTAVAVVAFTRFQQTTMEGTEMIEGAAFTHKIGRNLVTPGIKLALYF